jgi:hypothetical protein
MKTGKANNGNEDALFYILSVLAAVWAIVCVASLLARAK